MKLFITSRNVSKNTCIYVRVSEMKERQQFCGKKENFPLSHCCCCCYVHSFLPLQSIAFFFSLTHSVFSYKRVGDSFSQYFSPLWSPPPSFTTLKKLQPSSQENSSSLSYDRIQKKI